MESKANPAGFTAAVIARVKTDTAFRAVMSRADNPAFESAAWEYLIPYCNIEHDFERIPFALVGAAIARIRPDKDGNAEIGTAFDSICNSQEDRERESIRFRRLIACESVLDICAVLRPILQYLNSKGAPINVFPTPVGVFLEVKRIEKNWFCLPHARGGVSWNSPH